MMGEVVEREAAQHRGPRQVDASSWSSSATRASITDIAVPSERAGVWPAGSGLGGRVRGGRSEIATMVQCGPGRQSGSGAGLFGPVLVRDVNPRWPKLAVGSMVCREGAVWPLRRFRVRRSPRRVSRGRTPGPRTWCLVRARSRTACRLPRAGSRARRLLGHTSCRGSPSAS
jgi:hypothetical protein